MRLSHDQPAHTPPPLPPCWYSAALRLSHDQPARVVAERVEAVLGELRIQHIRHRMVWAGSSAQISGGEKQRWVAGWPGGWLGGVPW